MKIPTSKCTDTFNDEITRNSFYKFSGASPYSTKLIIRMNNVKDFNHHDFINKFSSTKPPFYNKQKNKSKLLYYIQKSQNANPPVKQNTITFIFQNFSIIFYKFSRVKEFYCTKRHHLTNLQHHQLHLQQYSSHYHQNLSEYSRCYSIFQWGQSCLLWSLYQKRKKKKNPQLYQEDPPRIQELLKNIQIWSQKHQEFTRKPFEENQTPTLQPQHESHIFRKKSHRSLEKKGIICKTEKQNRDSYQKNGDFGA
jgi:hypothetical protein